MIRPTIMNVADQSFTARVRQKLTPASAEKCPPHSSPESLKTTAESSPVKRSPAENYAKTHDSLTFPNARQRRLQSNPDERENLALQSQTDKKFRISYAALANPAKLEYLSALVDSVAPQTGIVKSHLQKLQELAHEKNCVISIRPVEDVATKLIENKHPTKGFHIKGKSASWGPQAGLICVDQSFSKLAGDQTKIKKFNEAVNGCLQERVVNKVKMPPYAVAIPLTLSEERLQELIKKEIIFYDESKLKIMAKGPDGIDHDFETTKENDRYAISYKGKPVEVLAPNKTSLPFTADYDLLLIAPSITKYGEEDKPAIPQFVYPKNGYPEGSTLHRMYGKKDDFNAKENHDIGNVSPRIEKMITDINKKLGRQDGTEVVHHNADSGSPAADYTTNYPATFFLPKAMGGFQEISVVHNLADLKKLMQTLKDENYHVPINPLWEKDLMSIKSKSFKDALDVFEPRKIAGK